MTASASTVTDWVMARVPARVLHAVGSVRGRLRPDDDAEWIAARLPEVDHAAELLDAGATWELGDSPTEGAVAIVDPGDGSTPIVVRFARSEAAAGALGRHWHQINQLAADDRLGEWRALAPTPVSWRPEADPPHLVEALARGVPGGSVADPLAVARLSILGLGPLHERTSEVRAVDAGDLDPWVREPVERLGEIATGNPQALEPLALRLVDAWQGRIVTRTRLLGDLSLGNVLVDAAHSAVVGYPDWRRGAVGPVITDRAHLALTVGAEQGGRDLGGQVLGVLSDPASFVSDPLMEGVDWPVAPAEVALLTWLWHVDASPHRVSRLWVVRNVEVVLAGLGDEVTASADAGSIWSGRLLPITVANLTIVALAAFDALAIVAALPSIAEDLGDVAQLPWVITGFLAASSVAIIVAGPVIDAVGVRRTFRLTAVWFLLTSAACAVAPNLTMLLIARVAQGFGGGLVIAVALASVGLAYPGHLRPRAFAANSVVWGVLGFGGPAVAAVVLAFGSWRLIFIVQLPLTAVAMLMGWRTLPSTRDRPQRIRMDGPGIAMLTLLTVVALLGVGQIGVRWWAAGVALAVSVGLVAAYWRHSGRAATPVLARPHLTRLPLRTVHVTSAAVLAAGLAADNYLPLYVRASRGRSIEFAAFTVLFLTIGWTFASLISSRLLDRWREVSVILLGAVLLLPSLAIGGVAVAVEAPLTVVFIGYFFVGMAIGFVSTAGLTLLQSGSAPDEMGRVNAAHQFLRTLGITYGVALGGAVLLFVVDRRVGDVEAVREVLAGDDVELGQATRDAVAAGLAWVHVVAAGAGIVCLLVAVVQWRRPSATDEHQHFAVE